MTVPPGPAASGQAPHVRLVYTDLDGTMVGPHGCFFRAEGGGLTLDPARALVALHEAGIALVLVSGRTRLQLQEAARVFGADGFVGEMGAVLGWDGGRAWELLEGAMPAGVAAGHATPYDALTATGVVDALLARHDGRRPGLGRLEPHAPWHLGHEADVMLRGRVEVADVEAWLAAEGYGWLRLRDNGALPPVGDAVPRHVYHLMADGLTKGLGVAHDLARRGLSAAQAVAVGDSLSDLEMAAHVGRMWVTANGARVPAVAARAAEVGAVVTADAVGLGWAEAVRHAAGR